MPAKPDRSDVIRYLSAMLSAVLLCFLLNLLWCYTVLLVVPQMGDAPSLEVQRRCRCARGLRDKRGRF